MKTDFTPMLQRDADDHGGRTDWYDQYQSVLKELNELKANQFKPSSPIEEEVGMDEAAKKESEDYGHNMKAHIECAFINGAAWHKRQIAKSNTTHPFKEVDRELENYFNKFHFEELGNCYVIDSENFLNFKAYIKGAQKHRNDELKELLEWVRIKTWGFEEPCEDGRAEIPPMELYNKIQSQLK